MFSVREKETWHTPWTCSCLVSWESHPQSLHRQGHPGSHRDPGLSAVTGSQNLEFDDW